MAAMAGGVAVAADEDPYLWLEQVEGAKALAQVKTWNAATESSPSAPRGA